MVTKKNPRRIAILTGGGDCPGLNAAIRAVTRTALKSGIEVVGVQDGFQGLHDNHMQGLTHRCVSGILNRGGTILRSSRFNPCKSKTVLASCRRHIAKARLEGLVVIGGNGSLGIALDFWQKVGIPTIGIPKTIDNDVPGTDYSIGFITAVETAVDAIDKLHTTAESHNFIMVVEVMGRHCGYLANYAGLAGGADFILVPEYRVSIDELVKSLSERHASGKNFSIVVVAEDARLYDGRGRVVVETGLLKDEYGHIKLSGAGLKVADLIAKKMGYETRCTVLGHLQRGGSPVAADRLLATVMGCEAANRVQAGEWGKLIALKNGRVVARDLSVVTSEPDKKLPRMDYEMAMKFFG